MNYTGVKNLIFLVFTLATTTACSQGHLVWKTILNEQFNNNDKSWHTESNDLRDARIWSGSLIDRFSRKGYAQRNIVPVNFNTNRDHVIEFSIANLHGDANMKYQVYEKKNNGTLKQEWENNPVWGFVWGFKDWANYNAIVFYNEREYNQYVSGNYLYSTKVKGYYKSNGETTTFLDWTEFQYLGTDEANIRIERFGGNSVRIVAGETLIYSYTGGVFQWYGNKIGPYIGAGAKVSLGNVFVGEKLPHPTTSLSEYSLKSYWSNEGADLVEGIYEAIVSRGNNPKYKLGLIKSDFGYELIYLSGAEQSGWNVGDVKAYLTKTATPNLFKVQYFMGDKSLNEDVYISFESGLMKVIWTDGKENLYLKLYPTSEDNVTTHGGANSSASGFAITPTGYIVTNHHVVEGASKISVRGVKGDFSKTYNARVIVVDRNNDLAIIKIDDQGFTSLSPPPYTINTTLSDVGNSVYALGYPLRATMGDEVKLTNGIVSSKTGFQGDITTYQITVPVQPGNSGGPLFDSKGNIIGIITAKHTGAENVSYAVKTSYLMNLIQAMNSRPSLPKTNMISSKSLSEQVKFIKEFVYIVETE